MKRRRFLFWVGAGLFGIGETLGLDIFDRMAAAAMRGGGRGGSSSSGGGSTGVSSSKAIGMSSNNVASQNYGSNYNTIPMGPIVDNDPLEIDPNDIGKVAGHRVARYGRPPSRWLRSLNAEELRTWLATVNPGHTGVSGGTYWDHLTRDHLFSADKIAGLTVNEQMKLHSAAHAGY